MCSEWERKDERQGGTQTSPNVSLYIGDWKDSAFIIYIFSLFFEAGSLGWPTFFTFLSQTPRS